MAVHHCSPFYLLMPKTSAEDEVPAIGALEVVPGHGSQVSGGGPDDPRTWDQLGDPMGSHRPRCFTQRLARQLPMGMGIGPGADRKGDDHGKPLHTPPNPVASLGNQGKLTIWDAHASY